MNTYEELPLGNVDDLKYFQQKLAKEKNPEAAKKLKKQIEHLELALETYDHER
jgi:hypothetical protein